MVRDFPYMLEGIDTDLSFLKLPTALSVSQSGKMPVFLKFLIKNNHSEGSRNTRMLCSITMK